MTQQQNKPVHRIRIGTMQASIWEIPVGQSIRHRVTFRRSYLRDGQWKETQSFDRDDMPRLMKCADLAHSWIFTHGKRTATDETSEAAPAMAEA